MKISYLYHAIKNDFIFVMIFHILVCNIVAFIHDYTIQDIMHYHTGGIYFGALSLLFIFMLQVPFLLLCSRLTKFNFVLAGLFVNALVAYCLVWWLRFSIDRTFILMSNQIAFLSFLFSVLYLFTTKKDRNNVKRFAIFFLGYFAFISAMLIPCL